MGTSDEQRLGLISMYFTPAILRGAKFATMEKTEQTQIEDIRNAITDRILTKRQHGWHMHR
eukprot:scaffold145575_cov23-Prasinocladus_malaysianus.AAC.1